MKKRKHTRRIIWHHSLSDFGDVHDIDSWHKARGFDGCGYHFVITIDGEVQAGRDVTMRGAHALGRNSDSIGVCICGDFRCYEPRVEQLRAAILLVHDLSQTIGWEHPLKMEFHRPHFFNLFEPSSYGRYDACPGRLLDRADFLEIVSRGRAEN